MSVSGISSSLFEFGNQNVQNKMQEFQQEFQQLGKDLQSGDLSAAQSDFTTLQQLAPQNNLTSTATTTTSSSGSSSLAQAFSQLGQDLQSGNLSGAQQDFSTIQQDFQQAAQSQGQQSEGHHHHHHHGGGGDNGSSAISQLFDQLGQALQSGNLSSAQQAYNSLAQDFQQGGQSTNSTPAASGVSVSA